MTSRQKPPVDWTELLGASQQTAERAIRDWVRRGRISSAEGRKLVRQVVRQARGRQADLEKMAHDGSRRVLHVVAGTMAGQLEDLGQGLEGLGRRLRVIEQQSATRRRTLVRRVRSARKAATRTARTARRRAA